MNEHLDLERIVAGSIEGEGATPLPDAFYDELISRAGDTPQRPRWLALITEAPMRTPSRPAVGSPMARVAVVTVATLLLALLTIGAGITGQRLLAAEDVIIVAQDGSGTVTTITEAVAMAEDGDTILVRPGTYSEAITIDEDVTLVGDGPVEAIVVEAPPDGPTMQVGESLLPRPEVAYAMLLVGSDASVDGFTFRGQGSRVHVAGGSPVLQGLLLEGVGLGGDTDTNIHGGLLISQGSGATVRDSVFEGGALRVLDGSEPTVTDNVLRGAPIIGGFGDGSVIRGNELLGPGRGGIGFTLPTTALVEDNVLTDVPWGIWTRGGIGIEEVGPLIRGNTISGAGEAISIGRGTAPTIEGNTLESNRVGIFLSKAGATTVSGNELTDNAIGIGIHDSDARVEDNTVRGGTAAVSINGDSSAELVANTIEGAARTGVTIGRGASPTLTDNRICDNGTNLLVADGASPVMEDNDICPDGPAPADD